MSNCVKADFKIRSKLYLLNPKEYVLEKHHQNSHLTHKVHRLEMYELFPLYIILIYFRYVSIYKKKKRFVF